MSFKLSEIDDGGHETFYRFGRCLYKYTDCGPWVVAVLLDGTEVYYESAEGNALSMDTVVDHVRVGSIVEGSDVEIGPYEVTDPKDFYKVVEQVNDEASFYWDRDNTNLYEVERPGYTTVYFRESWGDITWEDGYPFWIRKTHFKELVRLALEEYEDWDDGDSRTVGPYTITKVDQSYYTY